MIYYQLLELFHSESVLTPDGVGMVEDFWLSGNSSYKHFFTLPKDMVMARKINSETLNRKYQKISEVLVTATQDTREPDF